MIFGYFLDRIRSFLSRFRARDPEEEDSKLSPIDLGNKLLLQTEITIRAYILRPKYLYPVVVTFESQRGDGVAATVGDNVSATVIIYEDYFYKSVIKEKKGVIIHELVHALQRAPKYEGKIAWLIEGLADFIRCQYGLVPKNSSWYYYSARQFLLTLYSRNITEFYNVVSSINEGKEPPNLDNLIKAYQ